jgi:hypothetical protein
MITKTTTLKFMPYAQARIIHTENSVDLKSYKTVVCGIENGYAYCFGLYSQTTRKHISAFARELGLSYDIFKRCYTDNLLYNIDLKVFISRTTGEIVE